MDAEKEITKRSYVERSIKDSEEIRESMSTQEKKMFNKMKRSLIRTFISPNHSVKMLIDMAALEYINYIRNMKNGKGNTSRIAKSIIDCLSELDMTPRSKKSSEVSSTLSQIFQNLSEGTKDA